MIHTGEKPYQCAFEGCNKKFVEKGNMKTHYKTHIKTTKQEFQITHCEVIIPQGKSDNSSTDNGMDASTDLYMNKLFFGKKFKLTRLDQLRGGIGESDIYQLIKFG
jgi:uncharacterized Zn-finger protein